MWQTNDVKKMAVRKIVEVECKHIFIDILVELARKGYEIREVQ